MYTRLSTLFTALALLLVAALILPTLSQAQTSTKGRSWGKGATLKVYSGLPPSQEKAFAFALAQFNASGAKIKLVETSSAKKAQIILRLNNKQAVAGKAPQGKPTKGPAYIQLRLRNTKYNQPFQWAQLYVQQIGRALALSPGDKQCSAMNSSFEKACPVIKQEGRFTCRILQQTDKQALAKLYGGKASAESDNNCSEITGKPVVIPQPVQSLTVGTQTPPVGALEGRWATLQWKPSPGYLMEAFYVPGTCPQTIDVKQAVAVFPEGGDQQFDAKLGTLSVSTFPLDDNGNALPSSPYCFAARLIRELDGGTSDWTFVTADWHAPGSAPNW